MVANALVVSPTMGWIRLWITVRIGRRIQGDLRRCEGDFVDYCEDNIEIKSRGRSGEIVYGPTVYAFALNRTSIQWLPGA